LSTKYGGENVISREHREHILNLARLDSLPQFLTELNAEEELGQLAALNARILAEAQNPNRFQTTVIAFQTTEETGVGGAIIAADSLASTGMEISQGKFQKLFELDDLSSLGISGLAVSGQRIARHLEIQFQRFARRFHGLHAKTKANLVARAISRFGGCAPIFVVWDPEEVRGRIFKYDMVGSIVEINEGYASVGSGSTYIQSEMMTMAPNINKKPALEAAAYAFYFLRQAAHFDPGHTGKDFFIHLVTPTPLIPKKIVMLEDDWKFDQILSRGDPERIMKRFLQYYMRNDPSGTQTPPSTGDTSFEQSPQTDQSPEGGEKS
jgi:20S proteasome alpha/beta subunit